MSAELGAVVMFDQNLYRTGHMANRWMHVMVQHFEENAKVLAPKRTGELAAGITGTARRVGEKQMEGLIASNAPHTLYVLRGTGFPGKGKAGYIYTTKGFITRNEEDAYVTLWGRGEGSGFSRTRGSGERTQVRVRKKGYWLRLPAHEGYKAGFRFRVHGQDPNNFLVKAWRRTSHNHSSLRGATISEAIQF